MARSILAGGNSSRMGRDKARLEIAGQPLLTRQIQLPREVGAREIFISGRADRDYSRFGCPVLLDRFPGGGPLAGMERALVASSSTHLLVLAVDMPNLTPAVLERLLKNGGKGKGVLPRIGRRLEPLAALYPKMAAGLALDLLQHGDPAATAFAHVACNRVGLSCIRSERATHIASSIGTRRGLAAKRLLRLTKRSQPPLCSTLTGLRERSVEARQTPLRKAAWPQCLAAYLRAKTRSMSAIHRRHGNYGRRLLAP